MENLDESQSPPKQLEMILFTTGAVAVIIVNLCGNGLVFLLFYRYIELRTATNWLVFSQAITDAMVACVSMPLWIILPPLEMDSDIRYAFFHFHTWVDILTCCASISNVTLISLDRLCATNRPLHYQMLVTPKRVKVGIVCTWIFSVLVASLMLIRLTGVEIYGKIYVGFVVILLFFIPLGIVSITYIQIYCAIKAQIKRFKSLQISLESSSAEKLNKAKKTIAPKWIANFLKEIRISKAILIICSLFFFCWSPWYLITFLEYFAQHIVIPVSIIDVLVWLPFIFSATNSYIYAGMNQDFRSATKKLKQRYGLHLYTDKKLQKKERVSTLRELSTLSGKLSTTQRKDEE